MHKYMAFIFWGTLFLYIITLCTVTYVGVYLTYVAIPVIIVSGLLMKLFQPRNTITRSEKVIGGFFFGISELLEATATASEEFARQAKTANQSVKEYCDEKMSDMEKQ